MPGAGLGCSKQSAMIQKQKNLLDKDEGIKNEYLPNLDVEASV
jgi:hypothetical protein